ncbi:MAG: IscA/HesB family protein [Desulfosarcina sp.]|nr:IscA/HesB family protein [Desulfobacterales bacterium]
MLEVTPRAAKMVADYLKDKENLPIRIFVRLGGCGIRTFGVALEEVRKSDQVFEIGEFQYIINKKLLQMVQPIKFDSDGIGFRLSCSGAPQPQGCGNCGITCGVSGGYRCPGDCATCEFQCGYGQRIKR